MRSLAAVSFVALAVVLVAGAASARFVDPPDADVPAGIHPPQIGRFAVLVYNLNRGTKLKYAGVSNSDRQPLQGGVRYKMVVTGSQRRTPAAPPRSTRWLIVWGIPRTYRWELQVFKKTN